MVYFVDFVSLDCHDRLEMEELVHFTGEEGHGRYLDLHAFHKRYQNLQGVKNPEQIDYLYFLDIFAQFPDREVGTLFSDRH